MDNNRKGIALEVLVQNYNLENLTPEISIEDKYVTIPVTNRPAFPLTGFFVHFEGKRVQLIGNAETDYISHMSEDEKERIFDTMMGFGMPCIVFTSDNEPDPVMLKAAVKHGVPLLKTPRSTTTCSWESIMASPSTTCLSTRARRARSPH